MPRSRACTGLSPWLIVKWSVGLKEPGTSAGINLMWSRLIGFEAALYCTSLRKYPAISLRSR